MRQYAGLRRDGIAFAHRVEHGQQRAGRIDAVGGRIDADHRVAGAEQQAIQRGGGDAARIVGRMVGLQPHRQPARQADRVAEARHDAAFRGDGDQVLQPHQLADGRGHFRREAGAQRGQCFRFGGEQEFAEVADGKRGDRSERRRIVAVDDQPCNLVGFIWNDRFGEDGRQRHIGQRHLCRDAFGGGGRGEAGERIAGTERRRTRQQGAQVVEDVACAGECMGVGHAPVMPCRTAPAPEIVPPPRRRGRRTARCRHAW